MSNKFVMVSFIINVISFTAFLMSIVACFIGLISISTVLMLLWLLILSTAIDILLIALSVFSHYKKQKEKI